MTTMGLRQTNIRSIMIAICGLAPLLAFARVDPFLATMAAALLIAVAIPASAARGEERIWPRVALAVVIDLLLVVPWLAIRLATILGIWESGLPGKIEGIDGMFSLFLGTPLLWKVYASWEAWSLLRWWVLFGLLAWGLSRETASGRRTPQISAALIRFVPWLILMEVAFLVGVFFHQPMTFVNFEPAEDVRLRAWTVASWLEPGLWSHWLMRAAAPTLLAGTAFLRSVAGWRWSRSVLSAILLIPVAAAWSILWFAIYAEFQRVNFAP